jgi:hypothetical protein
MARIRPTNLRREEVDTVDEVQKAFVDVYRILREQQNEIGALATQPVPLKTETPVVDEPKSTHKKGTK